MARKIIAGEPIEITNPAYNKNFRKIENTPKIEEPKKIEESQKTEESQELKETIGVEDIKRQSKDGILTYKAAIKILNKIKNMLYTESVEKLQEIMSEYINYKISCRETSEIDEVIMLGAEILYLLYKRAMKEKMVIILPNRNQMKRILKQALININEINKVPTYIVTDLIPFKVALSNYKRIFKEYIDDTRSVIDKFFYDFLDDVLRIEAIIEKVKIADFTGGENKYLKIKR